MFNLNTQAVLFDLDGTLIESMELNFQAWAVAFQSIDKSINKLDYMLIEGRKIPQLVNDLSNIIDPEIISSLVKIKEGYFAENFTFKTYPGVDELLKKVKQIKIPIAIVTAARKERLYSTCPKSFISQFDVIITGDDCEIGKPHPEPYLLAASRLNIPSKRCTVIENAPLGIRSAKNAGMQCIAISSTLDRKFLSEADFVLESINQLVLEWNFNTRSNL
jgi:beta-phosphoglucomutase-like phosphatase (HAD superfamily)